MHYYSYVYLFIYLYRVIPDDCELMDKTLRTDTTYLDKLKTSYKAWLELK